MSAIDSLFLIAGSGRYPQLVAECARARGVKTIALVAFEGETAPETIAMADSCCQLRVGQLGKLLGAAKASGAAHAIMAGQIAPKNLFDLRPDMKALMILAKIKERNAETLFGAVASELAAVGVELLAATTFVEDHLAPVGWIAGPRPKARVVVDAKFGFRIAKETSRLDIGQSVVVRNGTVLAVEAFEGTDATLIRGGTLGRGKATLVKVSKPNQDLRFDVPVIGAKTLEIAAQNGVQTIAAEAGKVLLLDRPALSDQATRLGLTLFGVASD